MKDFFMVSGLLGLNYYPECDYEDLTEEEKHYIDYVDECLYFSKDEIIRNSCSKLMFLIFQYSVSDGQMSDDEFIKEKNEIYENLSEDDKEIVDYFGFCLIQSMGIYSEEKVNERKLNKGKE